MMIWFFFQQDLKSLEDNIEQSLLMEEQALANGSKDPLSVNGVSEGQLNAKHDVHPHLSNVILADHLLDSL